MEFKNIITNPLYAGPFGGFISILIVYLYYKYQNVEKEKDTYIKIFIGSTILISLILYVFFSDDFLNQKYDTSTPSLLPKSKGGFSAQLQMPSPADNIEKIMGSLPNVKDLTKESRKVSNIKMDIKQK